MTELEHMPKVETVDAEPWWCIVAHGTTFTQDHFRLWEDLCNGGDDYGTEYWRDMQCDEVEPTPEEVEAIAAARREGGCIPMVEVMSESEASCLTD